MNDDEFDERPLVDGGSEVEKFLLRSAELDQGSELARQRVLRAVQEERVPSTPRMRVRERVSWGIAAAAVVAFAWSSSRSTETTPGPAASAEVQQAESSAPAGAVVPPPVVRAAAADPCLKAPRATGKFPRIDQLLNNDARVAEAAGRFGVWFAEHDGTGIQKPSPGGEMTIDSLAPATPNYAIVTSGSEFKKWGASLGLQLAGGGCYDASVYDGVEFEARGPSRVTVLLQTVDVVPVDEGGTCEKGCWASHYKKIQLTGGFERYRIRYDDLVQHKFGSEVEFDARRLRSVIFQIPAEDTPFDFAVSEVSFFKE